MPWLDRIVRVPSSAGAFKFTGLFFPIELAMERGVAFFFGTTKPSDSQKLWMLRYKDR